MKKLEDIPKKNVFEVPEGYFDRLPNVIQSRVAAGKSESVWPTYLRLSLRYALPVLALGLALFFYSNRPPVASTEDLLANVDTASLVAFLDDTDVSTDDLLESVPLNQDEANAVEEGTLEEINVDADDIEYLKKEFGVDYF